MVYLIFMGILVACQLIILVFPLLYGMPFRANLLTLFPLAILGLNWLIYHNKPGVYVFSVVLWFLFGFFALFMVMTTTAAALAGADRERREVPVVFGKADSATSIVMVYHPGFSPLPKAVNTLIASSLARDGMKVTLCTPNAALKIDPKTKVLGLSSPLYGGTIRPPLANFIRRTDLTGVRCFFVLTGWFKHDWSAAGEKQYRKLIESKGGVFLGGFSASMFMPLPVSEARAFVEALEGKLGGGRASHAIGR